MRKWLYRLALSAFVLITAVAGFNIISGLVMYRQNAAVTKEAEEKFTHSDIPEKDRSGAKINRWQAKEADEPPQEKVDYYSAPEFTVDFDSLTAINSDVTGWIWMRDSNINMPVLLGDSNTDYIYTTYTGKRNSLGSIFADYRSEADDFSCRNTVLYGHNGKNGAMFGDLRHMTENSYYREHPCFYIFTPDGNISRYIIYSAYITTNDSRSYTFLFDDKGFGEYIDYTTAQSFIDTDTAPQATDTIVTLSTCTNAGEDDRYIVHGYKDKSFDNS